MKRLQDYSKYLKNKVKKDISKIQILDSSLKVELCNIFEYYCPNKERGYFIHTIGNSYNLDIGSILYLEVGLEIAFAAYYLRDDLLDDAEAILGVELNVNTRKRFNLLADILNEIGNTYFAKYIANTQGLESFIFEGFGKLSYGQLLGFSRKSIGISEYFELAYYKNGAMMESAVKMLRPLMENTTDFEILVEIADKFGILSQVRNDIEDFLNKEDDKSLYDLRNDQINFVLCVLSDILEEEDYKDILLKLKNNQSNKCAILDILEEYNALSTSFAFLDRTTSSTVDLASTLINKEAQGELENLLKNILVYE